MKGLVEGRPCAIIVSRMPVAAAALTSYEGDTKSNHGPLATRGRIKETR
ncbi:Hypothetical protein A7982_05964 [Minicystis rosea]|nr:Hypothetical protein A7982_05964 [Minicystis rosea]